MSSDIDYVVCEPRGYARPLTSRHRALMPERVWLTQFDPRHDPPFMINASGINTHTRVFMAMSPDTIIAAHHPADILNLIHLPDIDLHLLQTPPAREHPRPRQHTERTPSRTSRRQERDISSETIIAQKSAAAQHTGTASMINTPATAHMNPPSPGAPASESSTNPAEQPKKTVLKGKSGIGAYLTERTKRHQETTLP